MPAKVPQQDSSTSMPGTSVVASEDSSSKTGTPSATGGGSSVPVPVPVYCRPLMEKEPGMKVIIYIQGRTSSKNFEGAKLS